MAAKRRSLVKLMFYYATGIFWSCFIFLRMLWVLIKEGPRAVFKSSERHHRPNVMNDESLGTHKTIKLSEVKLHYVEAGDRNKPLMLFLHGFPECWFSWRYQLRAFKDKFRVVAVDMRGYGESDKPKDVAEYHLDKLTGDIRELIPALGHEKCILVIHDWGGLVGFCFALRFPQMVDKLIVCNIPHPKAIEETVFNTWKQFMMSWYIFVFQLPFLPEALLSSKDFAILSGFGKKRPEAVKAACDKDEVEAYKYSISQPGCLTAALNYYRAYLRYEPPIYEDYQIKAPTLFMWGVKDTALSRESAEASFRFIPDIKIHWFESAGHLVSQEDPDQVNKLMADFLS